jgi:hypothetical protein
VGVGAVRDQMGQDQIEHDQTDLIDDQRAVEKNRYAR